MASFDSVYIKYLHQIRHYAKCYLNDEEAAKDVAQEVFLSLWNKRDILYKEDDIFPYLITITKHKCLNILRHSKVKREYKDVLSKNYRQELNKMALSDQTSELIYSKEVNDILNKAYSKMSDEAKDSFKMSRFQGEKYEKIASLQNVSVKTVEYRVSKAMKILKLYFKKYKK